jgi:hypothetical protein
MIVTATRNSLSLLDTVGFQPALLIGPDERHQPRLHLQSQRFRALGDGLRCPVVVTIFRLDGLLQVPTPF